MPARPQQQRLPQNPQLFLRIRHPTLDPREITQALAIEPIQTVPCGSSESYWIAELPTSSMRELIEKYRGGVADLSIVQTNKEDMLALAGGTEWDHRIVLQLKVLTAEKPRTFLRQIIREGGSVALIVDRGEQRSPFVIKRAMATLAELGIELEVD
jgi:hypothetical protein